MPVLTPELHDLPRQLVGVAVGPTASIRQPINNAVFVAVVDLVAGLSGYAELTAQINHLLAIQEAGDESETFFHNMALLPGHGSLPQSEKALPMSPV